MSPRLSLSRQDVHLWLASLDQPLTVTQQLSETLSSDERKRVGRFYFQQDREHFVVARGLLRNILSHYLGIAPGDLQFCYGPWGKPELREEISQGRLRFSLSHSHGLCLYAVAWDRRVGIDLELIRFVPDAGQIARRSFSARENVLLLSIPPYQRQEAFFTLWTRKEAYLKAIGDGLSEPLNQIETLAPSGESLVVLSTEGQVRQRTDWYLQDLKPAQGYTAAVAAEGQGWRLAWCQCPGRFANWSPNTDLAENLWASINGESGPIEVKDWSLSSLTIPATLID